jgi:MFS family permease
MQESIAEGMDEIEFVEYCLVKAGGSNGKFQKFKISMTIWAGFAAFSLFIYAFSFFTLQPVLLCNGQVCSREDYCTGPSENNTIDRSSKETIDNWTSSMPNVLCSSNYTSLTAYYGTSMIAGYFLGSIFITPHADTIGRKKMNIIVTLIQCFAVTAISIIQLWSNSNIDYPGFVNYYLIVGFCFIMGLSSVPRYNVTMIYGLEFTTSAH